MHPKEYNIDVMANYWLGDYYQNDGWKRLTLFHKRTNSSGGSVSTPIAEIDIVKHPEIEGANNHCEIRVNVRNDVIRQGNEIIVDKNTKTLRHVNEVVDYEILKKAIEKIKENNLVNLPISIYVCIRHIDYFETEGTFWREDG